MKPTIAIRHTTDRHGEPLAIVYDFPGLYAEMRPAELRRLAMALAQAANDCEARATCKPHSTTAPVEYQIADEAGHMGTYAAACRLAAAGVPIETALRKLARRPA